MRQRRNIARAFIIAILAIGLGLVTVFSENLASSKKGSGKLSRVACVGDSITEITGYPEDLQTMLGNVSNVGNFGLSGATVNFNSSRPYYFKPEFQQAEGFLPTVVIIMLGTNDARTNIYSPMDNFVADYEMIIGRIQELSSKPQIFLVLPPPIFNNTIALNGTLFNEGIIPCIKQISSNMDLHLIDVYTPLVNLPEYFPDGVHPNSKGAKIIADLIYKAIN
jgi:acyl-CoA thioesterase-1